MQDDRGLCCSCFKDLFMAYFCHYTAGCVAKSVDSDQMPHNAISVYTVCIGLFVAIFSEKYVLSFVCIFFF